MVRKRIDKAGDASPVGKWGLAGLFGLLALISLLTSLVYLFSPHFMPYHAAALGQNWEGLSPQQQVLHLGLMRVAGAGFLVLAILNAVFGYRASFHQENLSALIAALCSFIVYAVGLYANLTIAAITGAVPPWPGTAFAMLMSMALIVWMGMRLKHS